MELLKGGVDFFFCPFDIFDLRTVVSPGVHFLGHSGQLVHGDRVGVTLASELEEFNPLRGVAICRLHCEAYHTGAKILSSWLRHQSWSFGVITDFRTNVDTGVKSVTAPREVVVAYLLVVGVELGYALLGLSAVRLSQSLVLGDV